jgi:copper oxidase (laccase) domain-containing protein
VGQDVFDSFALALPGQDVGFAFVRDLDRAGKYRADMFALARLMLARDGVRSVAGGQHCTATEAALFYSYRRDGVTGRQASLIWLK